jgi:hypothetical protein
MKSTIFSGIICDPTLCQTLGEIMPHASAKDNGAKNRDTFVAAVFGGGP